MLHFSKSKHARGFTLIEIVVAVAIFAVIASIIFPAMLEFLDIRERINEKHQQVVGMQKTFLFLANDLRYAANRLSKDEYGDRGKTTFTLNDDVLLDFTASYPDLSIAGLSVPRRVYWQLEDGQLQRVQYPVMDPDGDSRKIVQNLLAGVDDVEIEVSFIEDGRDNTDDKWSELTRLPDLIEISIEMQNRQTFRRLLTMQGGDSAAALNAASVPPQAGGANPGGSNPGGSNPNSTAPAPSSAGGDSPPGQGDS